MSTRNKILPYIQILVVICLMFSHGSVGINLPKKSDEFPCEGHRCGCELESDCKVHCCCGLFNNHDKFQSGNEQGNGFHVFMSSLKCQYGGDPITSITFIAKYLLDGQVQPIKESFLCFRSQDISNSLLDVFVSPPEKPPRRFI
ncbi:MAG: hypothetical protein E3K36_07860 [Candidatus Brocadia sp.]|nr:hypothetical protein [Candidatus Brocadia sp.]